MAKHYWLVKQEPEAYSWSDFVRDGKTNWEGVRNFQARNHLRAMKCGDQVLFYASVTTKAILGCAEVSREAFPDATAVEGDWSAVELKAGLPLKRPVPLSLIKDCPELSNLALLKQSRLSVMPLQKIEFDLLRKLGED